MSPANTGDQISMAAIDDAEKGLSDIQSRLGLSSTKVEHVEFAEDKKPSRLQIMSRITSLDTISSPTSPVHEGITPFSSVPILTLSWPAGEPKADATCLTTIVEKPPAKPKEKISRWILFVLWFNTYRKFFTLVTALNFVGIVMAALGRFKYADDHLGALVLGNLLLAVLMRNELFVRFLYTVFIYSLRSVRLVPAFLNILQANKSV